MICKNIHIKIRANLGAPSCFVPFAYDPSDITLWPDGIDNQDTVSEPRTGQSDAQNTYAPVPAYLPTPDNYMIPEHETADVPARVDSPDDWGKGYVSWDDDDDDEDVLHSNDDDRPGVTVTWPSAIAADSDREVDGQD